MSYRITKFGTVDLPELDPEDDLSTHEARSRLVLTPGGWFDAAGSGQAGVNPLPLRVRKTLISDGATPFDTNMAEFRELRALVDTRDRLWRQWADTDGTLEWTWARLNQVAVRADRKDNRNQVEMELAFQVLSESWFGATGYIADIGSFNITHGGSFAVQNTGNTNVTDVLLEMWAGSALLSPTLTHCRLRNMTTGHDIEWTGSLLAGTVLAINCGAQQVTNAGIDAYANFTQNSKERWFELAPGYNTLVVDVVGEDEYTHLTIGFHPPWR
jgi:hypothetical protein